MIINSVAGRPHGFCRRPQLRETLDVWVKEVYSGFSAFQVLTFPGSHSEVPYSADRVRLVLIHYDKEAGIVGPGAGERLNFVKHLFTRTGVNESPRTYRNNLVFLMAENSRVNGLKDAVKSLMAWERVQKDIETEQTNLAQANGATYADMVTGFRLLQQTPIPTEGT